MALTKVTSLMQNSAGITFADYGATGVGDETAIIQAVLTYASTNSIPVVDYSGKTYTYSTTLDVGAIEMYGNFTLNGTGTAFLNITGTITEIGTVASAATAGDKSITLTSATGLSADDVIIIWNSTPSSYSLHRSNYYDGEFSRVLSVVGTTVNLETTLASSYSAVSTNKVFKISGVNVIIDGPSFTGAGVFALRVQYAADCKISPTLVETTGNQAALVINKSYEVSVVGGRYSTPYDGVGGNYGISISNSQNILIDDVDSFGGRHAVTTGGDSENGAAPCRFITVQNSTLANDPASNVYNADFHGNTADSKYDNCVIYGSVGLAGERTSLENSIVYGLPNSANVMLGYQELVQGSITFRNVRAYVAEGMTAFAVVGNLGASLVDNISGPYQIIIESVFAKINSSVSRFINAYESSGQANAWIVDNIGFGGDASGLTAMFAFTKAGSGIDPSFIRITNLNFQLVDNYSLITVSGTTLSGVDLYLPTLVAGNPPVSGYYLQNTIVTRQPATAGTSIGWVCTTSGTPGTWKAFGSIAA